MLMIEMFLNRKKPGNSIQNWFMLCSFATVWEFGVVFSGPSLKVKPKYLPNLCWNSRHEKHVISSKAYIFYPNAADKPVWKHKLGVEQIMTLGDNMRYDKGNK